MTRQIIIEGQMARLVETNELAVSTLADIRPLLAVRAPTIFPVMPDHTRVAAFNPDAKKGIVIIELLPVRHNLRVHYDRGETGCTHRDYSRAEDNHASFRVQFPYHYFVYTFTLETRGNLDYGATIADFTLDQGHLYWRKDPLTTMDDRLVVAQIWNTRMGQICWGYQRHEVESFNRRIDDMVKNFPFTDFTAHYGSPTPNNYADYTEWEEASEGNPLVYREWAEFADEGIGVSVKSLVDRGIGVSDETIVADTARTFDAIPEPPTMFTIGRMFDWYERLPEALKQRFLWSLNRELTGAEPPAELDLNYTRPEPEPQPEPEAVAAAAEGEEVEIPGVGAVRIRRRRTAVTHLADGTPMPTGTAQTIIDPLFEPGEDQD